ncbi:hypothetical protein BJF78_27045 [Pseudonocardia sp. CNS-139]|nr:hypothetical protein BJF78_27045 [Pseudonocardia sp. CNS-139]
MAGLLAGAAPASAHGGVVGADLRIAASLGDRELTVVIRRVGQVPGPLRVDVVNHAESPGGVLRIGAAPWGGAPAGNETDVRLTDGGGFAGGVLQVDRAGSWELSVADGRETARLPFVVPQDVMAPWEWTVSGGYTAAGTLLLAALAAAAFGRRAWPPTALGAGAVAAVVVATTAALLSAGIPEPETDPLTGLPGPARPVAAPVAPPHVNLLASAELTAGRRGPVDLRLVDGATGRPADDLVVHHDALLHLMVLGPGGQFAHVHPVRLGPGHYRVWLTPAAGGTHRLFAEIERRGGGVQVVSAAVAASGPAVAGVDSGAPGPGDRILADGTAAHVQATGLVAGEPTVLGIELSRDGRPVRDLQPWLGMAGHLVTTGPDGGVGHVHALPVGAMGSGNAPDESVATGGPRVEFVYTFATPGRHRLWFQVERDYRVLTVPVDVDVAAGPEAGS